VSTPGEYRAEDRALLLRFYQRLLWDRLVRALPPSLRPNTITLFGESCALLSPLATWGAVRGHRALYAVSGVLLLAYMTADNVDGQHARRTRQTSALGEFLDHGLDGLASCAVLLCSAFALRVQGAALTGLVALGSLGFGGVFWAQYRTGLLVTPRVSAMEGVTGAALLQLAVGALGEPAWLQYEPGTVNAASALLVVLALCYVYAIASPVLRARAAGARLGELAAPLLVAVGALAYVRLGAGGLAPALIVALVVARMVCRMIVLRARGETRTFSGPAHLLTLAPLAGIALLGASPDACAWIGAAVAFAGYAWTFGTGVAFMATR
jgi:phosphatidylglycerophosphate synthase